MKTLTVLCNPEMLALLAPIEHSAPVTDASVTWHGPLHVAVYDADALQALPDSAFETSEAFWRHTPGLQIEVRFDPDAIRAEGLWGYLCDRYGLSSDRNLAGAVADLARDAGMTQIQFMNWIAEHTRQVAGGAR